MIPQPPNGDMPVVDYYRELHLDRGYSIQEINTKLKEQKQQWAQRASLAGSRGNQARELLALIDQAFEVFKDEDSRERYERSLRTGSSDNDEGVDWVARAWTYYFAKDYGPATVAARKARESNPTDPTAFVVSAWIELAEERLDSAENFASEAYVLDELGDDTVDVHRVRGATFAMKLKFERAVEAFKRALSRATDEYKADICWRLAYCELKLDRTSDAMSSCLLGIEKDADGSNLEALLENAHYATMIYSTDGKTWEEKVRRAQEHLTRVKNANIPEGVKRLLIQEREKLIEALTIESEVAALEKKIDDAWDYEFPLRALGVAVFFLLCFFGYPHFITFLLFAAPAAWVGFVFYKRYELKEMIKQYESKTKIVERLLDEILTPEEKADMKKTENDARKSN